MKIRPTFQFLAAFLIGVVAGALMLGSAIGPDARGHMSLRYPALGLFGLVFFVVGIASLFVSLAMMVSSARGKISRSNEKETEK